MALVLAGVLAIRALSVAQFPPLAPPQISVTPAWSILNDYSAAASGSIAVPVYKRFAFSTSLADTFLNNPPPGFKKNSFQLTTGLTYTLK